MPKDPLLTSEPTATGVDGGRTIVVQQSFPEPRPTTNPYIVMLRDALAATPGLEVRTFGWARALRADYDVFHVHWPEILVTGSTPLKTAARQALFALLVLRLRVARVPWVRTQHNLELPSGLSRVQRVLLRWADRWTTLRIALNDETPVSDDDLVAVVPHGHYRDWFARYPRAERDPAAFGYFGLVRRYKNVEGLVAAFTRLTGDVTLRVAGKPSSDELADRLRSLASDDPRVELSLHFLDDAELVEVATSVALVVLPYTHMHNSGSVLAALSLDTPVLVPANGTNQRLADEVGPGWLLQYEGELGPDHLAEALRSVQVDHGSPRPDLGARGWAETGRDHLGAYRRALVAALTRR